MKLAGSSERPFLKCAENNRIYKPHAISIDLFRRLIKQRLRDALSIVKALNVRVTTVAIGRETHWIYSASAMNGKCPKMASLMTGLAL